MAAPTHTSPETSNQESEKKEMRKRMFNIDMERLMDLVEEENNVFSDYQRKSKTLYTGGS